MGKNFTDRNKIDLWADPIGIGIQDTSMRYTQYYDMRGYESIDFLVSGIFEGSTHGQTAIQYTDFQIYKATDSSGGGNTAVSSATGRMTKVGTAITTAAKAKSLYISFSTKINDAAMGATFSVLGQDFFSATGNSAAGAFAGLSSVAATVAALSFITAFNTHTSATAWKAELGPTCTAFAEVMIRPKSETAVGSTVYVSAGGSTVLPVGVPRMGGHLGIKTEHLRDGYRYVALGMKSGASGMTTGTWVRRPVSVFAIRKRADDAPIASTGSDIQFSKNTYGTMF